VGAPPHTRRLCFLRGDADTDNLQIPKPLRVPSRLGPECPFSLACPSPNKSSSRASSPKGGGEKEGRWRRATGGGGGGHAGDGGCVADGFSIRSGVGGQVRVGGFETDSLPAVRY
jgi:hypothetical protein